MEKEKQYASVLKSTFLFGFVQVFNIGAKVIVNKVSVVILGPAGIGLIGIYTNAINLLKTGLGLGISESGVKEIAEEYNNTSDGQSFRKKLATFRKLMRVITIFSILVTMLISPLLSKFIFKNYEYTVSFLWLSFAVGLNVLHEGQMGILKGMRQLKNIARVKIAGPIAGLLIYIPCLYFLEERGIVPALILSALSFIAFSYLITRKELKEDIKIKLFDLIKESRQLITMGLALMIVVFLGFLSDLIIASYLANKSGLEIVGFYQAGVMIVSGYFGIVISSMTTDYYPRISAVNKDNIKLQEEVNKQAEVALSLIFPLVVIFLFLSPIIISVLYSDEFLKTILYTDFAIIGSAIVICGNCLGMILLAKQKSKIFILTSLIYRVIMIATSIILYSFYGLLGLGLTYLIMSIFHVILMGIIMRHNYKIGLEPNIYRHLSIIIVCSTLIILVKRYDHELIKYTVGGILTLFSILYSFLSLQKRTNFKFYKKK
jgi:PST family polysaccharide transporter